MKTINYLTYSISLKPYSSINKALMNRRGQIKVNYHSKNSERFHMIIDLYITIKILKTIHERFSEVRNEFNVIYFNKRLWNEYTCEIILNKNDFAIEVYTGAKLNWDNPSKTINQKINIHGSYCTAFNTLIDLANKSFPPNELENLESHLSRICFEE